MQILVCLVIFQAQKKVQLQFFRAIIIELSFLDGQTIDHPSTITEIQAV